MVEKSLSEIKAKKQDFNKFQESILLRGVYLVHSKVRLIKIEEKVFEEKNEL